MRRARKTPLSGNASLSEWRFPLSECHWRVGGSYRGAVSQSPSGVPGRDERARVRVHLRPVYRHVAKRHQPAPRHSFSTCANNAPKCSRCTRRNSLIVVPTRCDPPLPPVTAASERVLPASSTRGSRHRAEALKHGCRADFRRRTMPRPLYCKLKPSHRRCRPREFGRRHIVFDNSGGPPAPPQLSLFLRHRTSCNQSSTFHRPRLHSPETELSKYTQGGRRFRIWIRPTMRRYVGRVDSPQSANHIHAGRTALPNRSRWLPSSCRRCRTRSPGPPKSSCSRYRTPPKRSRHKRHSSRCRWRMVPARKYCC